MAIEVQPWLDFLERARPSVDWQEVGLVLVLDPGETTGWALFDHGDLRDFGQEPTGQDPAAMVALVRQHHAFDRSREHDFRYLERLVYEEYRVRGNRFKEHVGSEVITIQHIGAIKVVADELNIPLTKQTAGMAKGFATDTKLRHWGLYQKGMRHANDAIRHGIYYLLYGSERHDPRSTQE